MITWQWQSFQDLSADALYEVLSLRQEVFVVEQRCAYRDIDGCDRDALHLTGKDAGGKLVAYLRLLTPRSPAEDPVLGRVVVLGSRRGGGLGRQMMTLGIEKASELYGGHPVRLSAQRYLEAFYASLGFLATGEPYDEDGIPHISMVRHA